MKKNLTVLLLSITSVCFSQDVIYKNDETKIEAKIIEINPVEVKYKLFSNPDGPMYVIYRSSVAKITYQNGMVETITPQIIREEPQNVKEDYVNTQKQKSDDLFDDMLTRNIVSLNLLQAMLGFACASYEWVNPNLFYGIKVQAAYTFDAGNSISLATLFEGNSTGL